MSLCFRQTKQNLSADDCLISWDSVCGAMVTGCRCVLVSCDVIFSTQCVFSFSCVVGTHIFLLSMWGPDLFLTSLKLKWLNLYLRLWWGLKRVSTTLVQVNVMSSEVLKTFVCVCWLVAQLLAAGSTMTQQYHTCAGGACVQHLLVILRDSEMKTGWVSNRLSVLILTSLFFFCLLVLCRVLCMFLVFGLSPGPCLLFRVWPLSVYLDFR